jgi:hypothetical protein
MVQAKHIAALLIAACLASTGAAATPLEPPSADGKVTVGEKLDVLHLLTFR